MVAFIKTNQKVIIIVALVFAAAFLGGAAVGRIFGSGTKESIVEQASKGKVVNILLMGIDARSTNVNSRSDTMILASIDTKNKKVVMIWIPRDTRIETSSGHQYKINSVNNTQGPEAACETVGKLLGTTVDYYVITNFWGFEKIIDKLGGVTIDVEANFIHYDPDPYLNINIPKGTQHLNGENALKYVRYRGGPTADIGRTQRQAKFLKAVANEVMQTKTILKLPAILPEVKDSIRTNIPMDDILYLMTEAKDFSNAQIITQTLPGYSHTDPKDGASYWEPDKTIANGIIESLLAGKTYDVIHDPPSWVNKPAAETDDNEDESSTGTSTETKTGTNGQQPGAGDGTTKPGDKSGTTGKTTDGKTSPSSPSTGSNSSGGKTDTYPDVYPDIPQDVNKGTTPSPSTSGSNTQTNKTP